MSKRMPRLVFEIRWDEDGWGFFDPSGKRQAWRTSKQGAVEVASDALADAYLRCGILSELKIKNRGSGEIGDSRTYGDDPVKTKG